MTRSTSETVMASIGNERQRLVSTSVKIYRARRMGHNIIPIGLSLLGVLGGLLRYDRREGLLVTSNCDSR